MKIFVYKKFDQNSGNWKYPRLNFVQYLETGVELGYQILHECLWLKIT